MSDHHSTTAPQGETTITVPAPDPLEPLREAVRGVLLTPGASARFDWQAIEREAARLVLRELAAQKTRYTEQQREERIAYWRNLANT